MSDLREIVARAINPAGWKNYDEEKHPLKRDHFVALSLQQSDQVLRTLRAEGALVESELGGKIWAEIRKNLTGEFEANFKKHVDATSYEMSAVHLDECARLLARKIEENALTNTQEGE